MKKCLGMFSKNNVSEEDLDIDIHPTDSESTREIRMVDSNKNQKPNKKITKNAVLIGLNYTGTNAQLNGCINDANGMCKILHNKYSYNKATVLTDKEVKKTTIPDILTELIEDNSDTMFFQYSGHGVQVRDLDGDESDGMDEGLYSPNGEIVTDDVLNACVQQVPKGKTLVLIIDACHSGTIIDLPYQFDGKSVRKINNKFVDGDVVCITGCMDEQVSLDVYEKNNYYGAMSSGLQSIVGKINVNNITWMELLVRLRFELRTHKYAQIPQICFSRKSMLNEFVKF